MNYNLERKYGWQNKIYDAVSVSWKYQNKKNQGISYTISSIGFYCLVLATGQNKTLKLQVLELVHIFSCSNSSCK